MKNITKKLSIAFLILAPMTTANAAGAKRFSWFKRKPKTQVVADPGIDEKIDTIDVKDKNFRTKLFSLIIQIIDKYIDKASGDQEKLRDMLATENSLTSAQKKKIEKLIKKLDKNKTGSNRLKMLFNMVKHKFCG